MGREIINQNIGNGCLKFCIYYSLNESIYKSATNAQIPLPAGVRGVLRKQLCCLIYFPFLNNGNTDPKNNLTLFLFDVHFLAC